MLLPTPLESIRERFAMADGLALDYKPRVVRTLKGLFFLVGLAALVFDLFAHDVKALQQSATLLAYLALLGVAYAWYWWATRRGDFQNKYQDYRALAESLRVQFYWRLIGLKNGVEDHYLGQQRGDLKWIRIALRNWRLSEGRPGGEEVSAPSPGPSDPMLLVLKHWIRGQLRFFIKTARREERVLKCHEYLVGAFVGLGLALAAVTLMFLPRSEKPEPWHGPLLVAAGMAPVTAALLHGYIEKRALPEHLKRYGRMAVLFHRARRRLAHLLRCGDRHAARQLIRELGREALAENGDWVILHRERPLEMPKGG